MKRGSLLVLEGLDGSGKSTQLERLAARLRREGRDVVTTREPTDGLVGRRIRAMLRSGETRAPEEELAWFCEDREEHVRELIAPALAAGQSVVCDRYYLSTVAYQGARGLDWREILADCEARFPTPDLALVLEVDPRAGLGRARGREAEAHPAFENLAFLEQVAAVFAAIDRPWIARVDARADADRVAAEIARLVAERHA